MAKIAKSTGKPDRRMDKGVPIGVLMEYALQGLNDTEIAQLVGRAKQTVNERLKEFRASMGNFKTYKNARADIFAIMGRELLYSLTPSEIKSMPPASRITCAAILYDKERLERGQSTEIITYQDITNDIKAIDAEITDLENKLAAHGRLKAVSGNGGEPSECPALPPPGGAE